MRSSWSHSASPRALLALFAIAALPATAQAQANIDTAQPSYLTSGLGTTVNPVFEGGILEVDQANGTYGQAFTLDASGTNTIDQAGLNSTFSGSFSDAVNGVPGSLSFINSGSGGSVILSGLNSYTGATNIGDGVTLSTSANGSITGSSGVNLVGSTSVFDVSGASNAPQIGALSGVAGSNVRLGTKGLTVNNASATTFAGDISGSGTQAFVKAGAGVQTLSGVNTYTHETRISDGVLALSGVGSIAGSSRVDVGAGATFDISATSDGASVASLTGTGAVVLGGQVLTLTGGGGDTFDGVVGGVGGLTITGGSQTFTGVNTYTGGTTIRGGALTLAGAGTLGASTGALTLTGGSLDLGGTTQIVGVLTLSGGEIANGSLDATAFDVRGGAVAAALVGAGRLTQSGSGTTVLTGANAYTGGTTVQSGVLAVRGGATLGATGGALAISGGALDLGGSAQTVGTLTLSGGMIGSGSLEAGAFNVSGGVVAASLVGSGALTQSGFGTTILSAANSYTGGTTVSGGTLRLTGAGTLGSTSGGLSLTGGMLDLGGTSQTVGALGLSGGIVVDSVGGGALKASAYDLHDGTIRGALGGTAALTQSGPGTTVLLGANTYTGATTVTGGTLALSGSGAIAASSRLELAAGGAFDISETSAGASIKRLAGAGAIALGGRTLTLTSAADTFGGIIGGTGGLTIAGGSQTLTGANSYTGATTIAGPATLSLSGAGGVGPSHVVANGTFDISATADGASVAGLSGAGRIVLGGETLRLTGASDRFDGAIGGDGSLAVLGGVQVLAGANSYEGGTRVANATLGITRDAALGALQGGLVLDGAALAILDDLSSARTIQVSLRGGAVVTDGVEATLAGPIALEGTLVIGGTGRIDFTGVAQGEGALSIGGVFAHNGQISAAGVVVATGGTLRGAGVINAPTVVGGTLAPGNSPGTLTINGAVTLLATATSQFDIDGPGTSVGAGNFSRLVLGGADGRLTAGGLLAPRLRGITGSASNTYSPVLGQQLLIVSAAGGVAPDSSFSGLVQPSGLPAGTRFDALYAAQAVSLVLTPSAYGDLAAAGIAQTANAKAVGASLDALRPAAGLRMTPGRAAVYAPLYGLSAAELGGALDALSPDIYAHGVVGARQAWSQGAAAIGDQLAGRREPPSGLAGPASSDGVAVWGDVFHGVTEFSGSGGGARASTTGVIFGVDKAVGDGLVGVALAIDDLRTRATGGDVSEGQLFHAAVYGSLRRGQAFVDWQAGYLRMDQGVTRAGGPFGAPAEGESKLEGAGARVNAGLSLAVRGWLVEPTIGIAGGRLRADATTEVSAGALAQRIEEQRNDSLQTFMGMRLARSVRLTPDMALQVRGFAGWSHELEDTRASVRAGLAELGGPGFTVTSTPSGRDAAKLGASFAAQLTPRVTAYGSYDAELARHREAQRVAVGARLLW